jgi:PAS domain S-box-containing protein
MKAPRRLLLLEDNPFDAQLLKRTLSLEWPDCQVVHVNKEAAFAAALDPANLDLILSDYRLPGFDGLHALTLARERCPEVPFLFVSGAIGDEVAVESLKAGATDYVLKDRPARLVPAIRRALAEAEENARRKRSIREHEGLINSVDGIVWQAELPSLRFTFVSQQSERLLGYPARSWLEEPHFWQDHIHAEDRARAISLCTGLTAEDKYKHFEYRMLTAGGRVVWLRDIVSLRLEPGEAPQISGIMVDITKRKEAEAARRESEAIKSAIMEAALDCIMVMDHEGRIIELNPAAEKAFGYLRGEILGQLLVEKLLPPLEAKLHGLGMKHFPATGEGLALGKRLEMIGVRADHSQFPAELAIIPIKLRDQPAFTIYLRDITEAKRAEENMRRVQSKLQRTNQDLWGKNREIQNFYHTLSHELRTPLTSASEFISIVMDGLAGPLNQTQLEYLGIAKASCNQLKLCINDLFDATRLETGKLTIDVKPASLGSLVRQVVTTLKSTVTEKQIALSHEIQAELPEVPLDENRILQVLTNLLNNAIKFTGPGGSIVVKAFTAPRDADLVQVSVCDSGCGIPKEEQDRIFDRLYQIKAGDATTEQGVGLGLYLCRELVQLHGGNIWVESKPGQGSTFSFVLPRSRHLLHSNLLLIDDDPDTLAMLSDLLSAQQYNVRTARGGEEGLQEMRRQVPDIVLLDLSMPDPDGPATLREIRKNWGAIPVIVHTGFADNDLMRQALAFSPFTLLAKPCVPSQVLETVRKVQQSEDTAIWKKNHYGLQKPRF